VPPFDAQPDRKNGVVECSDPFRPIGFEFFPEVQMPRFEGKRVVIIGGTSGIGLETAKQLLAEGAKVLVTGRSDSGIESAKGQLGPDGVAVKSDATSLADIDTLAAYVKSEFSTIDALLICAGKSIFAPIEAVSEELYDELMAVNAKAAFFTAQKLVPVIKDGGAIVVITSIVNVVGVEMISIYSAAKAALRSMVRSLARELLPRGIRVNAVSPGPINTGILQKTMPKEAVDQIQQQYTAIIPMKRLGRPDEVARAMIFFAFDASFTTGAELAIDGGGAQI
jgi:NAD(P)-dependent dehydrogenase (short-subunit alcohol dehydrogenase family)